MFVPPMTLSVVLPVYNDPAGVDTTLRSLVEQDYPDYEVIPVDNNSTDETPNVIQDWAHRHPERIRPAAERAAQSSYAARNTGLRAARGEVIVFIDADMTAPPDWLRKVHEAFSTSGTDYLGYEVEVYVPDGQESFWGWYDSVMGLPSRYYYEEKQFVPTACLAVRRSVFEKVGTFDAEATSGGDKEFGERVHRHPDLTTNFRSDIQIFHPARTTFEAHRTKALRVGRGLARLYRTPSNSENASDVLREILLHALPPDPRRVVRQARGVAPHQLPALYLANMTLRTLRLCGALSHFLADPPQTKG